jgi:hypothetical protein
MIDLPNPREPIGPNVIRDLQTQLEWLKDVIRPFLHLRSSPTVRVTKTTNSLYFEASAPAGETTTGDSIVAAPLNMVWRGEYNNAMTLSPGDVVTVVGGDNGGAFVANIPVAAGGSEEPGEGATFSQVSQFGFGQWT